MMEVFDGIRTLLAVRRYLDRLVPEPVIRKILEAGRLTGSAMNLQPWHFIVIEDRETLRRLGALARSGPYVAAARWLSWSRSRKRGTPCQTRAVRFTRCC
jgi:nitroreductase